MDRAVGDRDGAVLSAARGTKTRGVTRKCGCKRTRWAIGEHGGQRISNIAILMLAYGAPRTNYSLRLLCEATTTHGVNDLRKVRMTARWADDEHEA